MMNNFIKQILILIILLNLSCREEFEIITEDFESALVVESTITNEMSFQEVKLSRTSLLEETPNAIENNASVKIKDNMGNVFSFSQNDNGVYVSNIEFKAEENRTYKLEITTEGNKIYSSSEVVLTPNSEITNFEAELSPDGKSVLVYINSNSPNDDVKYYRYEYIETYKIVAPLYNSSDALLSEESLETYDIYNNEDISEEYDINITPDEYEQKTCYSTLFSNEILQFSKLNIVGETDPRFLLKSIPAKASKLRDRYSIQVKQYSQSIDSYIYYKTVNELGNNSSILSENQTGFIKGNIEAINNSNEKVIGFFDVSSLVVQRTYFNYEDFNLDLPDYYTKCYRDTLNYEDYLDFFYDGDQNDRFLLFLKLKSGSKLVELFEDTKYIITNKECGDCTNYGTNITPEFWED